MNRVHPRTLLLILVCGVPLVVACAGLASFLLLRAGYGVAVWAGVPLLALLLISGITGMLLGRAAVRYGRRPEAGNRRIRNRDGV